MKVGSVGVPLPDVEVAIVDALNFERPPFNFGPPVELLNENCEEAGGGWRDNRTHTRSEGAQARRDHQVHGDAQDPGQAPG